MSTSAEFVRSVFDLKDLPSDGFPEIALIGRSNVGKSSLINAIAAKKGLAKTSSTPGKTRCLNYYRFDGKYHVVDTPGYGYARQSHDDRQKWHNLMDSYFRNRQEIVAVGVVVDSRHQGLANDLEALEWVESQDRKLFIVLTKADKTTQRELALHENYLRTEFRNAESVFAVSSNTGKGILALRRYLAQLASE